MRQWGPPRRTRGSTWRVRLTRAMFAGSLVVMLAHGVAVVLARIARPEDGAVVNVFRMFDAGREGSLAAWWTGALLLTAAAAAVLAASLASRSDGRPRVEARAWVVLAVLLALLSFDEIASVHEQGALLTLAMLEPGSSLAALGWLIPATIVVLLALLVLVPAVRALPSVPRRYVSAGLAISVGAAMGMEVLNLLLTKAGASLGVRLLVISAEEMLEMVGVIVAFVGITKAIDVERASGGTYLRYRSGTPKAVPFRWLEPDAERGTPDLVPRGEGSHHVQSAVR